MIECVENKGRDKQERTKLESIFARVFRSIVKQSRLTVPDGGVTPQTTLDSLNFTAGISGANFSLLIADLEKEFRQDEYYFDLGDFDLDAFIKVENLVSGVETRLKKAKEKRLGTATFERVKQVITRTFLDAGEDAIQLDAKLTDLGYHPNNPPGGFDLDLAELAMELESEFGDDHKGFSVSDDDLARVATVQDLVALVDAKGKPTLERIRRVLHDLNPQWADEELVSDLNLSDHMNFAEALEFFEKLDAEFGTKLPMKTLVNCNTLTEMAEVIDKELEK